MTKNPEIFGMHLTHPGKEVQNPHGLDCGSRGLACGPRIVWSFKNDGTANSMLFVTQGGKGRPLLS